MARPDPSGFPSVKAVIIGDRATGPDLEAALRAEGLEPSFPEPVTGGSADSEIAGLAAELLAIEGVLGADRPAAVVLTEASDRALAGALAATKLLIPVAVAGIDGSERGEAELLARLADHSLSSEPGEIAAWVRSASRASASGRS
jgi:hypothetical protein